MLVSGHLTISIDHFPSNVQKQLEYMSHDDVWKDPNPNCVFPPPPPAHSKQQQDQQQIKQFAQPDVHSTASMVGQVETSDGVPSGLQEERVHLHDGGSSPPHDAKGMAADSNTSRHGPPRQPDDVRPPAIRPLWKRNRPVRQVQEVPTSLEVGQSSGGMAGLVSKLICTVATFTAAITGSISSPTYAPKPRPRPPMPTPDRVARNLISGPSPEEAMMGSVLNEAAQDLAPFMITEDH